MRREGGSRLANAIEKRVAAPAVRAEKLTQAILAKAFCGEQVPRPSWPAAKAATTTVLRFGPNPNVSAITAFGYRFAPTRATRGIWTSASQKLLGQLASRTGFPSWANVGTQGVVQKRPFLGNSRTVSGDWLCPSS